MTDQLAGGGGELRLADALASREDAGRRRLAHDLKTPLNGILGFAELLHSGKAGPLSAKQQEFVGDILTSARQLLGLIRERLEGDGAVAPATPPARTLPGPQAETDPERGACPAAERPTIPASRA